MTLTWRELFILTLRDPGGAAQVVLSTPISRAELYMAVIAGAAVNSVILGMFPPVYPMADAVPDFFRHPFSFFVLGAGFMMLFVQILTWVGRSVGGTGILDDMLKLMVWLQFVRIALQIVGLVLSLSLPPIGALFAIFATGLSLWIVLNFIQAGHGLETLGKSVMVLFVTFVGLIVGLSFLLAVLGIGVVGVSPNV